MRRVAGRAGVAAFALLVCTTTANARAAPQAPRFLVSLFVAEKGKPIRAIVEIVRLHGRVERVVDEPSSYISLEARWSPDRSLIAWVGANGIQVERADGNAQRTLAGCDQGCEAAWFAWSPDSRWILIGEGHRLVAVSVGSGRTVEILHAPDRVAFTALNWQPGGTIAYLRRDPGRTVVYCCRLDLYVASANGTHRRRLWSAADGGVHDTPGTVWSADGHYAILGTQARDPTDPTFAVLDLASGQLHVPAPGTETSGSAWSPDSHVYAVGGSDVRIFTPDGRLVRSLGRPGSPIGWSRDGDLYLQGEPRGRGLYVSRGGVEPPQRLFSVPPTQSLESFDPA